MRVTVRQARLDDRDDVFGFTRDTWPDRDSGDYIDRVFESWVETDGADQRTLVAEIDGAAAGLLQVTLLSTFEAWCQGMRVHPEHRGRGIGTRLTHAAFDWARDRGATVARNIIFSWNTGGLGLARAAGFEPVTEFRWVYPDPTNDAELGMERHGDPDAAWAFWGRSPTRQALAGLALDLDETWAISELTRHDLSRAADDSGLIVLHDVGTRGFTYRTRTFERDSDDSLECWAEYGVGAWADADAAVALLDAVARDAAAGEADRARLLIPETAGTVSDAAAAGVRINDGPDFVFDADLTRGPFREGSDVT